MSDGAPPSGRPDVIVIGAGHNGLVAACYLARAGLEVLVVEGQPAIGGMSASSACVPGAPGHLINTCAVDFIMLQASGVVAELDLARVGYREVEVDPPIVYLHADGPSIAFWRDPARTAEEIRRFSPADAEAFLELLRTLDSALSMTLPLMLTNPCRPAASALARAAVNAARRPRRTAGLPALMLSSAAQVIDERFRHPVVRDAIATQCAVPGSITTDGSASSLMVLAIGARFGIRRPLGGTQALPDALAATLRAHGGSIRTGAAVEEILVTNGRATGVRLAGGDTLTAARAVLATCDPKTALGRLLPGGTLAPHLAARVAHIPSDNGGSSQFKVDLALSGRVAPDRHQRCRGDGLDLRPSAILIGGYEEGIAAHRAASAGRIPEHPPMWLVVPTGTDPSQAPPGQDTLYLWAGAMPLHAEPSWEACSAPAAAVMLAEAGTIYGGLPDLEIGRVSENPEQFARRLGVSNGSLFHVDPLVTRLGPLRPAPGLAGYRTPVPGLFLGGAGSHPSFLVTGMPGRNSARTILRAVGSSRG